MTNTETKFPTVINKDLLLLSIKIYIVKSLSSGYVKFPDADVYISYEHTYIVKQHSVPGLSKETTTRVKGTSSGKGKGLLA